MWEKLRVKQSLRFAILSIPLFVAAPIAASEKPDFYVLASEEFSWWEAESRVLVDWDKRPRMTGLDCKATSARERHLSVNLMHPAESAEFRYSFEFKLPDTNLINRNVQSISVGGRSYQFKYLQVRIIPWFGVYGPDEVVLAYGITRAMVRPNENYGWYPLEFLLPQFFEAEEARLSVAGEFEIDHGNYETRFEELRVDMDGFKEAMKWCSDQVNPSKAAEFPSELKKALDN
jgi:hypothetical protein